MMEDSAFIDGGLSDEAQIVIDEIGKGNVGSFQLQFTNILETVKNISIPVSQVEEAPAEGTYFDGSSIDDFVCIQESDTRLESGPSMFAVLLWRKKEDGAVGRLICDMFNTSAGEPFSDNPRGALRRVIEYAEELGYDVSVAPEPESFLFKEDEDSRATTVTNDAGGYFDPTPRDLVSDVRHDIIYGLENMGFDAEALHHEVAEGQHEINFTYGDTLSTVDNVTTFRSVVRAVATEHDPHAAFMSEPVPRISGSGMHTHISLFKDDENAFYNGDDKFDLGDTAKSFVAGISGHVLAIMTVADSTVNSYKHFIPGYEMPVYIAQSDHNRSAPICGPAARTPVASRIETHFPDSFCDPYLTFATLIHAGFDDVEKGLDCPDPVRENIYEFNEAKCKEYGIETLPNDLGGAVDTLEEDGVIQEVLGDHVFEKFVGAKRSEFKDYLVDVSQWELDRYLEAL